jgi:hypothetical protein
MKMTTTLPTLHITAEHIRDGVYIGPDVSAVVGHIEIAADLGCVQFSSSIVATGRIRALSGSGIEAGLGIKAGLGIEAGLGIKAGWGIEAGLGIKAGLGIRAGLGIEAGSGIKAGWVIEAGSGIEAGLGIEAGSGIKAGWGIACGLSLHCKWLSAGLRIFAGLVSWRLPGPGDDEIRGELRGGTIAFGTLVIPKKGVAP